METIVFTLGVMLENIMAASRRHTVKQDNY
jgi:hypothetical protein